jgi:hypothetical protein
MAFSAQNRQFDELCLAQIAMDFGGLRKREGFAGL